MKRSRTWAAAFLTAITVFVLCNAALAAPPSSVPNSGVSHNCVATTSGILFYKDHHYHLGVDVRIFGPHGGQREYVLGALRDDSC